MLLSKAQVSWFWREWSKACSVQGWQGDEKEQRRREVLLEVGFNSLTKVDKTAGFDRLKARVMALQYCLEGASNQVYPANGDKRRHLHLIRTQYIPALGRLVPDPAAYVAEVCRDKFGHSGPWESLGEHPVTGPKRVQELLFTLAARVSSLRRAADAGKLDISLVNPPSEAPIGHFAPSQDSTAPF